MQSCRHAPRKTLTHSVCPYSALPPSLIYLSRSFSLSLSTQHQHITSSFSFPLSYFHSTTLLSSLVSAARFACMLLFSYTASASTHHHTAPAPVHSTFRTPRILYDILFSILAPFSHLFSLLLFRVSLCLFSISHTQHWHIYIYSVKDHQLV